MIRPVLGQEALELAMQDPFVDELRSARLAQDARLEAFSGLIDARMLRLGALRDAVLPKISQNEKARQLFELSVSTGATPRLWVDLVSSVVMEPDPKHYRLVQDLADTREIVFETENLVEMQTYLTRFLAHRLVAEEREKARQRRTKLTASGKYGHWDMVMVWIAGLGVGILAAIGWGLTAGRR